jgi:hypothetical protein
MSLIEIFGFLLFIFMSLVFVFLGVLGIKYRRIYIRTSRGGPMDRKGKEAVLWGFLLIAAFGIFGGMFIFSFFQSVEEFYKYPLIFGLVAGAFLTAKWYAKNYKWDLKVGKTKTKA